MDGPSFSKAIGDAIFVMLAVTLIVGGATAIGLWELFWFLWEHVSFSWK